MVHLGIRDVQWHSPQPHHLWLAPLARVRSLNAPKSGEACDASEGEWRGTAAVARAPSFVSGQHPVLAGAEGPVTAMGASATARPKSVRAGLEEGAEWRARRSHGKRDAAARRVNWPHSHRSIDRSLRPDVDHRGRRHMRISSRRLGPVWTDAYDLILALGFPREGGSIMEPSQVPLRESPKDAAAESRPGDRRLPHDPRG